MRIAQPILLAALIGVFLPACAAEAEDDAAAAQIGVTARHPSPNSQAAKVSHPFWDEGNILLFTAVGAGRTLDYLSTRNFRDRRVNEWLLTNSVVDNKPLLAGIEAASVAASIGVSYLFHRSGHHKLERWISIIHVGVAVGGSARNFTLRTSRPSGAAH